MTVKASARSIWMLATGLFLFSTGPSQAAASADDASANPKSATAAAAAPAPHRNFRHGWHHRKSYAHRRSNKLALKTSIEEKATVAGAADGNEVFVNIPPLVANAKAQLQAPGIPNEKAGAMPAPANDLPQDPTNAKTDNGIVAADQLNDVDRALQESNAPASLSAMASASPPPASVTATRRESSAWDQTSLIGKIFIGFGALLTMASAARMFMA
jgi:hypothetical protein